MSFRAVTYWAGQAYQKWAKGLALSAAAAGVPLDVHELQDAGEWQRNTLRKPEVILRALEEHPNDDIVWLDADCSVLSYPALFDQFDARVGVFVEGPDLHSINGSVSFFRNMSWTRGLLRGWQEWNVERADHADDHNLLAALDRWGMQHMRCLPPAYCWNERLMRARFPTARPVIEMHLTHMLRNLG